MSLFSQWSEMSLAPKDGSMVEIRDAGGTMTGFARFVSGQWRGLNGRIIKPHSGAMWMLVPEHIAIHFEAQTKN